MSENTTVNNRETRIKSEITKLKKIFKDIGKDKLKAADGLIKRAAFMAVTLEELEQTMNKDGVTSEYKNGENQYGTKKSPEVEVYNTMVKNYTAVVKSLCDMSPGMTPTSETAELLAFTSRRR